MIRFACPGCKTVLQLADEYAGAVARCPRCQTRMRAPRPAAVTASGRPDLGALKPPPTTAISERPLSPPPAPPSNGAATPALRSASRWRTWGANTLREIAQTGAATWAQTVRLARYGGGIWRRRSLRGKACRAQSALGQRLLETNGGDAQLRERLQNLDERIRAAQAAKGSTRALRAERQALVRQMGAGALTQLVLPAGLEAEMSQARDAESALHAQDERLRQERSALPPTVRADWLRVGTGYAVVLGMCVLTLTLVAGGSGKPKDGAGGETADLTKIDSALKEVPADAVFFQSWLRNREQVEAVANSRAWGKLNSLPMVKSLWESMEAQLGQPGSPLAEFRKWYEQPENRELVELLLDLGSHEVFAYGGEHTVGFLDVFQGVYGSVQYGSPLLQLQGLDPEAAQLKVLYQALKENQDRLRAPDLIIGFKVTKKEAAQNQLKRLEQEYEKRLGQDERFKGRLTREKVGDQEFLTLRLDGKMIPWEQLPLRQFQEKPGEFDQLVKKLSALPLTVSIGLRDDYLLVGVGESADHLARFGQGKRLIDAPEFKSLAPFADRRLTSIGYASKALNTRLTTSKKDIDNFARLAREGLDRATMPADVRKRLDKDLTALAEDLKTLIAEPGTQLSFSFLSERGVESYAHDWGGSGSLDGSKPLSLLNHLGGSPLVATVGRSKPPLETYQMLVKWIKAAYGYVDELMVPRLEGPEKEQYRQFVKEFLPLLRRLNAATANLLLPALADGQAALVIDSKLASKQWLEALPATEKPLPLPELAVLAGVSDAALLEKAIAEYQAIAKELIARGQKLAPGQVPNLKFPEPRTVKVDGGTLHTFALPKELGVDPQVAPTAGLSERVAVAALSPDHAKRLLASTPLEVDSKPLADLTRPMAGATYVNCSGLVELLESWLEMAVRVAGPNLPAPAANEEEVLKQLRVVLEVLKVFRSYSSSTYLQDGATVTHSETVIRDIGGK